MRTTLSIALLASLTLSSAPAAAQSSAAVPVQLSVKSATLTIDGASTMHDYSLVTSSLTIVSADDVDGASLLQPGVLRGLELHIPVASFTSEKDGLKKKMLETMKADKHPVIAFKLGDYAIDSETVRTKGTLTVAGVAREIDVELNVKETAAGVQVRGTRALSMKEFGIKAPTMFMGMLKTNDRVTIKFEFHLTHAAKASN